MVYGMLGLLVVLGVSKAFGTINSSPWFNAGIAALFIVLGLAMFDIIAIDFSKWQAKFGIRKNESGSFFVAFAMGCISALLAGACVAPVVIGVITYTQKLYADGVTVALALPFLLGVGMALPWPFAGAGLSFLPKPGGWMEKVKWAFGALFIIVALYFYAWPAYQQFSNRFVDESAVAASVAELDEYGWMTDLAAGLAKAKEEDKPVLIDFWATWCKNCLVMNKTTLKDQAVLDALDGYVKIKYQAEDPSASPVSEVWDYYELKGLPTYLILQPEEG
jgi:thiol:disulfide interchange protein